MKFRVSTAVVLVTVSFFHVLAQPAPDDSARVIAHLQAWIRGQSQYLEAIPKENANREAQNAIVAKMASVVSYLKEVHPDPKQDRELKRQAVETILTLPRDNQGEFRKELELLSRFPGPAGERALSLLISFEVQPPPKVVAVPRGSEVQKMLTKDAPEKLLKTLQAVKDARQQCPAPAMLKEWEKDLAILLADREKVYVESGKKLDTLYKKSDDAKHAFKKSAGAVRSRDFSPPVPFQAVANEFEAMMKKVADLRSDAFYQVQGIFTLKVRGGGNDYRRSHHELMVDSLFTEFPRFMSHFQTTDFLLDPKGKALKSPFYVDKNEKEPALGLKKFADLKDAKFADFFTKLPKVEGAEQGFGVTEKGRVAFDKVFGEVLSSSLFGTSYCDVTEVQLDRMGELDAVREKAVAKVAEWNKLVEKAAAIGKANPEYRVEYKKMVAERDQLKAVAEASEAEWVAADKAREGYQKSQLLPVSAALADLAACHRDVTTTDQRLLSHGAVPSQSQLDAHLATYQHATEKAKGVPFRPRPTPLP